MKNFLKKLAEISKKTLKAETLLEVVVATAVFMIIIGPASSLYISNIKNSAINKNDLIGASLAEEALEMMKNIRDTNLLKFSANADVNGNNVCWNAKPDPLRTINDCGAIENQIGEGSYRIDIDILDAQLPIRLVGGQVPLNPENLVNNFRLALNEISEVNVTQPGGEVVPGSPAPCTNFNRPRCHDHFVTDNDTHLYVYSSGSLPSPFYRELKVDSLLDLDGNDATKEAMQITATVVYMAGSKPRIIKRTMILTNRPPSI